MGLILVRYGEIALKGKNRSMFTRQLRANMRQALRSNGLAGRVFEEDRRLFVETDQPAAALEHLRHVFGIVSLSAVVSVDKSIEAMQAEALRMAHEFGLTALNTFATDARRADKRFPYTSPEVGRLVGGVVQEATNARVDLSGQADMIIGIEIRNDGVFMYGDVARAHGGLPVPLSGRVVALLSGGIDSPVAAWLMMKRGAGIIPVHFTQNETETGKVLDNCEILRQYSYGWRLDPVIISHAEVVEPTLEKLERLNAGRWACVFCKRLMLAKAAEIAEARGAQAIVMGDSMGQVASQTLHNMEVISYGVTKPILRPLIGMDKTDIMALAREIGTFSVSTRDALGCCYLPANPLTKGSMDSLKAILERLDHV